MSDEKLNEAFLKLFLEWYCDAMGMEIATMLDFFSLDSLKSEWVGSFGAILFNSFYIC